MDDRPDRPLSYRRYRRRILGWGAAGVLGLGLIGAAIHVNRAEDDLESRSVDVLVDAGVFDVTVHFSGQDGELRCTTAGPVDVPAEVVEEIGDLWGVSSVVVDATCRAAADGAADDAVPASTDPAPIDTSDATSDDPAGTSTMDVDAGSDAPDLDPLNEVVTSDSQFSTLAGLLGDAGLVDLLAGDGPFTLFAPTNAAFETLGADVTGALARDPALLEAVLSHHVTDGTFLAADLVERADRADRVLEMLDGNEVTIDRDSSGDDELTTAVTITDTITDTITVMITVMITSGDFVAAVTESDLVASNGVVHAIDQVLLPADLEIGATAGPPPGADFVDGRLVLVGQVATAAQRDVLVGAAGTAVDPTNVVDELDVSAASLVTDDTVETLATVLAAMPPHLVGGTVVVIAPGLDRPATDEVVAVHGTYVSEARRDAFEAELEGLAVTVELVERAVADSAAAAAIEADLNDIVTGDPILFDPSSTTITAGSAATLDRVAAVAQRLGGVSIVVEGHTDTDGLAASNLALSEGRARSVRDALVLRGLDADQLTIVGFGGTEPILDAAGVEDKAASRRVEFVVSTAS